MLSGRLRLTLCAAAATLLAATALLPLTAGSGWYWQGVFLVAVVTATGAAGRRIPLARPLTVLAQALVALLVLTLIFASGQALGGVLPGPSALHQFGEVFDEGTQDVSQYAIPAPVSDGIRLLLLSGVAGVALLVDALAVTYRSAAPAGLPLLALYSVAAGLNQDGSRWLFFLLAGCGYLLLLLAEGRERLTQWGRVFGGGGRPARAESAFEPGGGQAVSPVRTGRRIGAVALGIALVTPLLLPSLSGGLLDGTGNGNGQGGGGGAVTAVNPIVRLQQSLNQPSDREVLRYRTSDGQQDKNLYMRFVALDQFDGTSWTPSQRKLTDVPDYLGDPRGLFPQVRTDQVRVKVKVADWYRQQWLPMPYPAVRVNAGGGWRYEPEGRSIFGDHGKTTAGMDYDLTSLQVEPTAQQLADAQPPPADLKREYTRVPGSLPREVRQTALRITRNASNDYERALALQDYFRENFVYDVKVHLNPDDPRAIVRFLKDKQGFCVHFSFTMAAMARTLGIPARVAVGFVPGDPESDGSMSVGLKDAHAWPELYFEGAGWTRFEPTPTRGSVPDYTLQETQTPNTGSAAPSDQPSASASPSGSPSASNSNCGIEARRLGESCGTDDLTAAGGGGGSGGPPAGRTALGVTAGVLLLLVVPSLPMLWRLRTRRRRLAGDPLPLAAWREMTDLAWDFGLPPDDAQTPRTAAARLVDFGRLDTEAAAAARRVAGAVEQALYAPRPRPVAGLAADVRRVAGGLRASAGFGTRLRATLAPRSAAQVLWAFSERWSAVSARWGAGLRRLSEGLRRQPSDERA